MDIFGQPDYYPSPSSDVVKYREPDDFKGKRSILNADLVALVVDLSSPVDAVDYTVISDFFLIYRNFMSPMQLQHLLVMRFQWCVNEIVSGISIAKRRKKIGEIALVRTFVLMRHWVLNYFVQDFLVNVNLRLPFIKFLNGRLEEYPKIVRCTVINLKKAWIHCAKRVWTNLELDEPKPVGQDELWLNYNIKDITELDELKKRNSQLSLYAIQGSSSPNFRNQSVLSLYKSSDVFRLPAPSLADKRNRENRTASMILFPQDNSNVKTVDTKSPVNSWPGTSANTDSEKSSLKGRKKISRLSELTKVSTVMKDVEYPSFPGINKLMPPTPAKKLELILQLPDERDSARNSNLSSHVRRSVSAGKVANIMRSTSVRKSNNLGRSASMGRTYSVSRSSNFRTSMIHHGAVGLLTKWKKNHTYTNRHEHEASVKKKENTKPEMDNFVKYVISINSLQDRNFAPEEMANLVSTKFDLLSARTIEEVEYLVTLENNLMKEVEKTVAESDIPPLIKKSPVENKMQTVDMTQFSAMDNLNIYQTVHSIAHSVLSLSKTLNQHKEQQQQNVVTSPSFGALERRRVQSAMPFVPVQTQSRLSMNSQIMDGDGTPNLSDAGPQRLIFHGSGIPHNNAKELSTVTPSDTSSKSVTPTRLRRSPSPKRTCPSPSRQPLPNVQEHHNLSPEGDRSDGASTLSCVSYDSKLSNSENNPTLQGRRSKRMSLTFPNDDHSLKRKEAQHNLREFTFEGKDRMGEQNHRGEQDLPLKEQDHLEEQDTCSVDSFVTTNEPESYGDIEGKKGDEDGEIVEGIEVNESAANDKIVGGIKKIGVDENHEIDAGGIQGGEDDEIMKDVGFNESGEVFKGLKDPQGDEDGEVVEIVECVEGIQGGEDVGFNESDEAVEGLKDPQGDEDGEVVEIVECVEGIQGGEDVGFNESDEAVEGLKDTQGDEDEEVVEILEYVEGIQGGEDDEIIEDIGFNESGQVVEGLRVIQGNQGGEDQEIIKIVEDIEGDQSKKAIEGVESTQGGGDKKTIKIVEDVEDDHSNEVVEGLKGVKGVEGVEGARGVEDDRIVESVEGDENGEITEGVKDTEDGEIVGGIQGIRGVEGDKSIQGVKADEGDEMVEMVEDDMIIGSIGGVIDLKGNKNEGNKNEGNSLHKANDFTATTVRQASGRVSLTARRTRIYSNPKESMRSASQRVFEDPDFIFKDKALREKEVELLELQNSMPNRLSTADSVDTTMLFSSRHGSPKPNKMLQPDRIRLSATPSIRSLTSAQPNSVSDTLEKYDGMLNPRVCLDLTPQNKNKNGLQPQMSTDSSFNYSTSNDEGSQNGLGISVGPGSKYLFAPDNGSPDYASPAKNVEALKNKFFEDDNDDTFELESKNQDDESPAKDYVGNGQGQNFEGKSHNVERLLETIVGKQKEMPKLGAPSTPNTMDWNNFSEDSVVDDPVNVALMKLEGTYKHGREGEEKGPLRPKSSDSVLAKEVSLLGIADVAGGLPNHGNKRKSLLIETRRQTIMNFPYTPTTEEGHFEKKGSVARQAKELLVQYNIKDPSLLVDNCEQHIPFILMYDSSSIAQQMTLIEKELLSEIDWKDLLNVDLTYNGPAITSWLQLLVQNESMSGIELAIARFNLTVDWIISEIILTADIKLKRNTIQRFIHVADHCRSFQNYNTLMEIVLALNSTAVQTFVEAWRLIEPGDLIIWGELKKIPSLDRNYAYIRNLLNNIDPIKGCAPFIVVYLSDLSLNSEKRTWIKDGEIVNYNKFETNVQIVKNFIQRVQWSKFYNFRVDHELLSKCVYLTALSHAEMAQVIDKLNR